MSRENVSDGAMTITADAIPLVEAATRRVSLFALIKQRGRVLLVREAKPGTSVRWSLPGGKLDPNETLLKGLRRELKEEAGCRIKIGDIAHVISRDERGALSLVFHCRQTSKIKKDDARYFALKKLPANLTAQTRVVLQGTPKSFVRVKKR